MRKKIIQILDKYIFDPLLSYIEKNVCRGNHEWVSKKLIDGNSIHYCERCGKFFGKK